MVSPTVISLTDSGHNLSMLIDFGEEEESKGKESSESKVDSELKIHPSSSNKSLLLDNFSNAISVIFHSNNYISEYPKITTPPPKFVL
ncbi:hypothetical protein [uncultured Polaribacter sp.]|uniref:hypothetical protein n=1 Tax=uncultured Polaribacter sp. TaxID=174711 RepID=UPI00259BB346|nr:hypothetical protein [uncultured Polaribacter sp.]